MVPADSHRISRVPRYSGAGPANVPTSPTRLSRSAAPLSSGFCCRSTRSFAGPTTPGGASPRPRFGLLRVRSPLLAESLLFSSPAGTEMFQFPAFAPAWQVTGSLPPGFPIRTSAHQRVFAPKRGFSQLVTSFFASESHRHPPCALIRFPFFLSPCIYDLVARLSLSPITPIGERRGTRLLDCSCSTSTPPRSRAAAWGLRFALPSCQ